MPVSFVEEGQGAALEAFEREPLPSWRRSGFWTTTVRKLRLDALEPRRYEPVGSLAELPRVVRDALGPQELAGIIVQRGASTVFTELSPEAAEQGVIVTSLERAVEEHRELVERWYMKRLSHEEGKFAAASAAFWTGGAFVHVPPEVRLEQPLQVVWLIDEPGTAQYAHTLAVVGEFAECALREYCLAPPLERELSSNGSSGGRRSTPGASSSTRGRAPR